MKPRTPSRRVTLQDISRAAGVSVMTVSNVVRGKDKLVKLETRERVESVIRRLGYRPNTSARNLRLSQNRSVGLVIVDTDPAFLTDPFISNMVSGLSNYLSSLDFTLDVQGIEPSRFESATILSKAGNDALCAILSGPKELRRKQLSYLGRLGQPTVVFQEAFTSPSANIAVVRQDDYNGGRLLGRHLARKKIRSAAFLRPTLEWCAVEQRERGFRKAISESTSEIEVETVLASSERFEDVEAKVTNLLTERLPSAIVAATDSMAAAALNAAEKLGFRVPQDLLVTGFNGFDVWRITRPKLTTVESPAYAMGGRAGELVVARLSDGKFIERNTVFPVSMIVGDSA